MDKTNSIPGINQTIDRLKVRCWESQVPGSSSITLVPSGIVDDIYRPTVECRGSDIMKYQGEYINTFHTGVSTDLATGNIYYVSQNEEIVGTVAYAAINIHTLSTDGNLYTEKIVDETMLWDLHAYGGLSYETKLESHGVIFTRPGDEHLYVVVGLSASKFETDAAGSRREGGVHYVKVIKYNPLTKVVVYTHKLMNTTLSTYWMYWRISFDAKFNEDFSTIIIASRFTDYRWPGGDYVSKVKVIKYNVDTKENIGVQLTVDEKDYEGVIVEITRDAILLLYPRDMDRYDRTDHVIKLDSTTLDTIYMGTKAINPNTFGDNEYLRRRSIFNNKYDGDIIVPRFCSDDNSTYRAADLAYIPFDGNTPPETAYSISDDIWENDFGSTYIEEYRCRTKDNGLVFSYFNQVLDENGRTETDYTRILIRTVGYSERYNQWDSDIIGCKDRLYTIPSSRPYNYYVSLVHNPNSKFAYVTLAQVDYKTDLYHIDFKYTDVFKVDIGDDMSDELKDIKEYWAYDTNSIYKNINGELIRTISTVKYDTLPDTFKFKEGHPIFTEQPWRVPSNTPPEF